MVTTLPLGGSAFSEAFLVQDHPVQNDAQRPQANWNLFSPEYFHTMRIPLLEGRLPTDTDLSHSKDLMIIDEQIAHHYWPHESAIGKRMRFGSMLKPGPWAQVIGVVSDVKHHGLEAPDEPQIYELYPSLPSPYGNLVVRYRGNGASTAEYVRKAIGQLDRDVAIGRVQTMEEVLSESVAAPRFRTTILAGFGIFALILAGLGIYGAIAWAVASRSREIGIRMAVGASPRRMRYQVIASAAKLVAAGLGLGSFGAIAFLQALRSFVFATQPLDVSVLLASVALLAIIGVSSAIIPAARAAETDPALALRHE
jgi:putative ABC transport system permease protein